MLKICVALTLIFPTIGCGVRGDPVPPGYPAELGRGRPAFKDPSQAISYPPLPSAEEMEKRLQEEDKDDDKKDEKINSRLAE